MAFSSDTFVCMKDETNGAYTALCKNSNGNPNEAHEIVIIPEIKIDDSTMIECTYTTVTPPKSYSHRCLLSKPIWMWGSPMGSNDAGVCIGNEIIHSNSKTQQNHNDTNNHLTSMDLVRLALMFGDSALDAVKVIDHYLQNYVQNGCMEWMNDRGKAYYSSYLIADYNELWVVESINQYFVAKKYCHGVHVISNRYNLSSPFDMISTTLRDYCDEQYIDWKYALDINHQFGEWRHTYFNDSFNRQQFIEKYLNDILKERKLNINDCCNVLRKHKYGIDEGLIGMNICSHGSYGPIRCVNTNASIICIMRRDGTVLNLVTGTAAPCIGMFKPIYIECSIPQALGVPFRKYRNGNFVNLCIRNGRNDMVQTFDGLLKKKRDIISTTNVLLYNDGIRNNNKQLWWKHSIFHRLYLKYFINDGEFGAYIGGKMGTFEHKMFKELVEGYHEYNAVHATDDEIITKQQKIVDGYWMESYDILDDILTHTQNEIAIGNINKMDNDKSFLAKIAALFSIFHNYSVLIRYLHQLKWSHWNKMAGMYINKDGVLSDSNRNSASGNSIVSSMFNTHHILKWIKVLFASIWSVLLIAIGWKMFN